MKKIFSKIKNRVGKVKLFGILVFLFSFVLIFTPIRPAYAGVGTDIAVEIISFITSIIVGLEGLIITLLTKILFQVVRYSNFVNSQAVSLGWNIVRDVANLFFVVILLAIAIATILRVESYNFKRLLPKLLLMAVLVNFSKTICGLIIDFSQVIMSTFVAGFAAIGGEGNLMSALRINDIINADLSTGGGFTSDILPYFISAILMIIMLLITIMVIAVILVVFTVRIVMLWILIVISPMAYILSAFPQGQRYAQQWWTEFSKYIIIGPVLAFFLWLTFAIASAGQPIAEQEGLVTKIEITASSVGQQFNTGSSSAVNAIRTPEKMYSFIIAIAMLLASLVITQQMGVAGGSFAGQMYGRIRQGGAWARKLATSPFSGVKNLAVGGLARSKRFNELLGGFAGGRIPIVRTLAFKAYTGLQGAEGKLAEDAEKYVKNIKGPGALPILKRFANLSPTTPWRAAVADAAKKRNPSSIDNPKDFERYVKGMSEEDFGKLSPRAITRIAERARDGEQNDIFTNQKNFFLQKASSAQRKAAGFDATKDDMLAHTGGDISLTHPYTELRYQNNMQSLYGTAGGAYKPADIDTKYMSDEEEIAEEREAKNLKLSETRARVKKEGEKFFQSAEFSQNRDKYLSKKEYDRLKEAEVTLPEFYRPGAESEKPKPAESPTGVTLGGFAQGGRLLATNFAEVAKAAGIEKLGGKTFRGNAGVSLKGADAIKIAQGVKTVLGGQLEKLKQAQSNEATRAALRQFGYSDKELTDDNLSKIKQDTVQAAEGSIARLENTESIGREGFAMINKGRGAARGLEVARHEALGHKQWDQIDENGEIRSELLEKIPKAQREKILQDNKSLDEAVAAIEQGKYGRDLQMQFRESRQKTEREIGLRLAQKQAGAPAEPLELEREEQVNLRSPITGDAKEVLRELFAAKPAIQESLSRGIGGGIIGGDYQQLRRSINDLALAVTGLSKVQKNQLGSLGQAITRLNYILPKGDAQPLEVLASLEDAGLNEKDLAKFAADLESAIGEQLSEAA